MAGAYILGTITGGAGVILVTRYVLRTLGGE
jgi:hypothetical protein